MATKESQVYLALRFGIDQLEKLIDHRLNDSLKQISQSSDDKRMQVELQKHDTVQLQFPQDRIIGHIPLQMDLTYDLGLTKLKGNGKIVLEFEVTYRIEPDWKLDTKTNLLAHHWIEKPRMQVAGLDLPIGALVDFMIEETEKRVEETIDQLVEKQIDLQGRIFNAWRKLHSPIPLDKEKMINMVVRPTKLGMSRLLAQAGVLESTILLQGEPEIYYGSPSRKYELKAISAFAYKQLAYRSSEVYIDVHLLYSKLQEEVHKKLKKKTIDVVGRQIVIEDFKLNQKDNLLHIYVQISGSFKGELYITGRPYLDTAQHQIEVDELKVEVNTKNVFHRTAAWLFAGKIKKKIQEGIHKQLEVALTKTKSKLQTDLNGLNVTDSIELRTQIDELKATGLSLQESELIATVGIQAKLALVTTRSDEKSNSVPQ